jgi:hypothetical protein
VVSGERHQKFSVPASLDPGRISIASASGSSAANSRARHSGLGEVAYDMAIRTSTFAKVVESWIDRTFPTLRFVRRRRRDGEFEAFIRAPRGSQAGYLIVFTHGGDLWVRFNQPNVCYAVESLAELASVVRGLVSERVLFMVTYRRGAWSGTTLIRRGVVPRTARSGTARLVSWTGRYDNEG